MLDRLGPKQRPLPALNSHGPHRTPRHEREWGARTTSTAAAPARCGTRPLTNRHRDAGRSMRQGCEGALRRSRKQERTNQLPVDDHDGHTGRSDRTAQTKPKRGGGFADQQHRSPRNARTPELRQVQKSQCPCALTNRKTEQENAPFAACTSLGTTRDPLPRKDRGPIASHLSTAPGRSPAQHKTSVQRMGAPIGPPATRRRSSFLSGWGLGLGCVT